MSAIILRYNFRGEAGFAIFSGKIDRGVDRANVVAKRAKGPVAAPDGPRAATLDNEITYGSH
jgi:hypothetical protein